MLSASQAAKNARIPKLHVRVLIFLFFGHAIFAGRPATEDARVWVGTWGASMTSGPSDTPVFKDQTLREIIHTSIGGSLVRVRFSNAFGSRPLVIGAAHIAIPLWGSIVRPHSDRTLTFDGRSTTTVPPHAAALSDPIEFTLEPLSDVAVSVYLPDATSAETGHWAAAQTSYIAPGDRTSSALMWPTSATISWFFLAGVEVMTSEETRAVVAIGDSLTDGSQSTLDANRRWPNVLAVRLAKARSRRIAVLNAGLAGNRLLHDGPHGTVPPYGPSALGRFDRDVLAQPGVKYVIVLAGINDIVNANVGDPDHVSADEIIARLQRFVDRAHTNGLVIFGGTLLPCEGSGTSGCDTTERAAKRQQVNQWIRTTKAFDAVIDFDRAVRDPSHPTRLLPRYDSGDHVHPNDAGYEAMGNAIDLSLFSRSRAH